MVRPYSSLLVISASHWPAYDGAMKTFDASLAWERGAQPFTDQRYSRAHTWQFDGGLSVPLPMSDAAAVDPEEALVAAHTRCYIASSLRGEVVVEGPA
jgi:organic hydroperoxide reductase OsmC/OhrA